VDAARGDLRDRLARQVRRVDRRGEGRVAEVRGQAGSTVLVGPKRKHFLGGHSPRPGPKGAIVVVQVELFPQHQRHRLKRVLQIARITHQHPQERAYVPPLATNRCRNSAFCAIPILVSSFGFGSNWSIFLSAHGPQKQTRKIKDLPAPPPRLDKNRRQVA
jgi:hypothetical protein